MNKYKLAKEFIRVFNLKKGYEYSDLQSVAEKLGYEVFEYQRYNPVHEKMFIEIKALNLSLISNSFTHEDEITKFIFINCVISEEEKKIALFHELIHIYRNHISQNKNISVTQEKETTDLHFISDFILKYRNKIIAFILTLILSIVTLVVLTINLCIAIPAINEQYGLSEYVYITPSGYCYHTENCEFGKDYERSIKVKRADVIKSYLPCSKCNADKY